MKLTDCDPRVRSAHRWRRLSVLLAAMERALEGAARLDAFIPSAPGAGRPRSDHAARLEFDARLSAIEVRIDRELDRLTADRLAVDLLAKQIKRLGTTASAA